MVHPSASNTSSESILRIQRRSREAQVFFENLRDGICNRLENVVVNQWIFFFPETITSLRLEVLFSQTPILYPRILQLLNQFDAERVGFLAERKKISNSQEIPKELLDYWFAHWDTLTFESPLDCIDTFFARELEEAGKLFESIGVYYKWGERINNIHDSNQLEVINALVNLIESSFPLTSASIGLYEEMTYLDGTHISQLNNLFEKEKAELLEELNLAYDVFSKDPVLESLFPYEGLLESVNHKVKSIFSALTLLLDDRTHTSYVFYGNTISLLEQFEKWDSLERLTDEQVLAISQSFHSERKIAMKQRHEMELERQRERRESYAQISLNPSAISAHAKDISSVWNIIKRRISRISDDFDKLAKFDYQYQMERQRLIRRFSLHGIHPDKLSS